jgi:hypothetical protein
MQSLWQKNTEWNGNSTKRPFGIAHRRMSTYAEQTGLEK